MEKFDFETIPNRRNTDSDRWDVKPGELPMTIADMDFKTAPAIIKAMKKKIELGAFGYEFPKDDYFNAVKDWYQIEHNTDLKTDWMIFTTGVVPAISSIVRRISHIGDNVLIQAPVYNIFYNSILNNGRHVLSSDLVYDGQSYHVDWQDLEEKLARPLTTLMIFCNPHNPTGMVWTKEEVQRLADLCLKYHVVLLSDEIHGDLVRDGYHYVPAFSVEGAARDQIISLVSPSKSFNVAALHAATVVVPNENLRNMVSRGLNSDEIAEPNLLAIPATIAAYKYGQEWLHALIKQLEGNFTYVEKFIKRNISDLKVVSGPATYLIWIDVSKITDDSGTLVKYLHEKTGLIVTQGEVYGGNGRKFIRINLASPMSMIKDGMNRLAEGINSFKK
ncbi:MalY/PatB family protein [Lactobacillus kalixensis]|uniref:cysteine-S-conjugate beta-lyase n=1 Tax=Lactobacillus kalixensis DSM 16043 TaxID=1423763 RepID=A0A0R1UDC0_9LACO|nr:MalY/PatB family protein [Lactobacillus kalixensis]KRL91404.1 PLP-dependent aminotransferase [Lactobacillus kalixensis DSM 16043]